MPYAYKGTEWVGFDNVKSIKLKTEYIIDNNLGGAMIWALDTDDFDGKFCNQGKYPLINTIKSVMAGTFNDSINIEPELTTTQPSTTSYITIMMSTSSIFNARTETTSSNFTVVDNTTSIDNTTFASITESNIFTSEPTTLPLMSENTTLAYNESIYTSSTTETNSTIHSTH